MEKNRSYKMHGGNSIQIMNPELTSLETLLLLSQQVTQSNFGNQMSLCAIYPAKVGLCSGDCAFCAQSVHHNCEITPVRVENLDEEKVLYHGKKLWEMGVRHYSLVTSGETLTDEEFEEILRLLTRLKEETNMGLCASLGMLNAKRAKNLKAAGVSRYHHNIETSSSFFKEICSSHSYEDKIETINLARQAGMELCCGGIIGMGETPRQRIEMAFAIKDLDVDCVPINILNPIPGTRLERQEPLSVEEIIRTIAVFRMILPDKILKFAGGREQAMGGKEEIGYKAGINSLLVGDYLTTKGDTIREEIRKLKNLGYTFSE